MTVTRFLTLCTLTCLTLFSAGVASAAIIIPKPPVLDASGYILVDADSGKVLVEHNADERLPPASMTKMMTSYIAVHELVEGNVSEDTQVPISVTAWKRAARKCGCVKAPKSA